MSAPPEHYAMLYTMPEHRIAHLTQSLFLKMQSIIKDSTQGKTKRKIHVCKAKFIQMMRVKYLLTHNNFDI
jgi:hypothetical protein